MFLCRSCLTGSEEVGFGALGSNVLVILEATMMFMKYSQAPEAQNLAVFFLKNCKVPFVSVQNFSEYLVQFVMFMG